MRGVALVLGVVVAVASTVARADDEDAEELDDAGTGVYVGLAGFYAIEGLDGPGPVDDTGGLNLRIGYRVLPRLGLELQTEWAKGFRVKFTGREVETWALTANYRAYFSEGRVQPYLLLGAGFLTADDGRSRSYDFAGRIGGGFDVGITEHVAVLVEGVYLGAADVDYGTVGCGVQYRF
jgi:hypothetical protein